MAILNNCFYSFKCETAFQIRHLSSRANSLSEKWGSIPVLLAGDFNTTPQVEILHGNFIDPPSIGIPSFLDILLANDRVPYTSSCQHQRCASPHYSDLCANDVKYYSLSCITSYVIFQVLLLFEMNLNLICSWISCLMTEGNYLAKEAATLLKFLVKSRT